MKRLFALILVVIMCFSLFACGSDEILNNDDIETTASAIADNSEMEDVPPSDGGDNLDNVSEFLDYLCGEWETLSTDAEGKSATITEDGNINIDGSSYELKLKSGSEDGAVFEILDGETSVGSLHLSIEDNGDLKLYLKDFSEFDFALYKPDNYEIIKITKDNVYEYFELYDEWSENKNAFGELTSVSIATNLVLKEEYYSRISHWLMGNEAALEKGAIEWLFKRSGVDVVIDLENRTYKFENFQSGTEDTSTSVKEFICNSDFAGFYSRTLRLTPDSEGRHTYTWACAYEMDITRIELDLYLVADND